MTSGNAKSIYDAGRPDPRCPFASSSTAPAAREFVGSNEEERFELGADLDLAGAVGGR